MAQEALAAILAHRWEAKKYSIPSITTADPGRGADVLGEVQLVAGWGAQGDGMCRSAKTGK